MTTDEFRRLPQKVQTAWEMVWIWGLKPGDEHPTRRGWFLRNELGEGFEPLWFRPPHRVWKWIRPVAFVVYGGLMALGITAAFLFG